MLLLSPTAAPLQHYEKRTNMGASQRRILAAAASLAIATSTFGYVAPAIAAPTTTTVTNDQVTEPTTAPTETPTAPPETAASAPTEASTAPTAQEPSASPTTVTPTAASAPPEVPKTAPATSEGLSNESGIFFGQVFGLLGALKVLPEETTPYDRSLFQHWIDADGDQCNTREEVLIAESQVPATVGAGCTVTAGQWSGWYGGGTAFDASGIEIDHFVALAEAWDSGAAHWTADQRRDFANDLAIDESLVAVTSSINQSKSAYDPAEWMPSDWRLQCQYVTSWLEVKYRWNLAVDQTEHDFIYSYLRDSSCGYNTQYFPEKGGTAEPTTSGAFPVQGAIGAKYATASEVVGLPIEAEQSGQRFGGAYQRFQRGTIAYLQQYGAYMVIGGINTVWQSIGAQNSDLGYPTSDEYAPMAGGVMQNFQFGKISWNPATGSRITKGGIGVTWDNAGGPLSGLGYPTTDEYSPMAGGVMQGFQYGKISWNAATGSRITKGGIGATWDSVGGPLSGLGYPTTDEYATANGGVTQEFQYGQIVYSAATGSRFIRGGIGATWISIGGPRSALGYPTTNEADGLSGGGAKQYFQYGEIVWSPGAGTKIITGGIRSAWAGQGSEAGRLGYPTTNEYGVTGGSAQDFQGGRITWYPGSTRIEYASDAYNPAPTQPAAPTPSQPSRPADVDCKDFSTQAQAQAWYNYYYPYYGDIARLDGADNDGRVCESLP